MCVVDLPVSRGDTTDEIREPDTAGIERVPASSGRNDLLCQNARSGSNSAQLRAQDGGDPAMLTIQPTPNRSVSIPNVSPHGAFSNGTPTVAPSDSPSQ